MNINSLKTSFVDELRRILPDLYNLDILGHSPLMHLFGLEQHPDAPSMLQHMLTNAIEALRPDASIPPTSKAWRFFHILHYRYKEQYTQQEVALDLSLSIRQVRRQEKIAQRVLADYLWAHHNLEQQTHLIDASPPPETQENLSASVDTPSQEQELAWLEKSIPSEVVDPRTLIPAVLETARPHIQALQVSVACSLPDDLPPLNVHQTTVRQAILNIITTAARYAPEGQINITAKALPQQASVQIQIKAQRAGSPYTVKINKKGVDNLDIAQKLISISEGSLTVTIDTEAEVPFRADVLLPVSEQISVLIVDDNADTLTLLERYLAGSRYHFIGTSNPQEVLTLAEELSPDIIVLDVMLPGIDGWELLGRLREHPQIGTVPIIVCTILPQEEFALTLGAAQFIRKPVSREALLSALDQVLRRSR
jgi:CheY-like chemotaxis protein